MVRGLSARVAASQTRVAGALERFEATTRQLYLSDVDRVAAESTALRGLWYACDEAEVTAFAALGDWAALRAVSAGRASSRSLPPCHPWHVEELDGL